MRRLIALSALVVGCAVVTWVPLADTASGAKPVETAAAQPYTPKINAASNEPQLTLKRMQVPRGTRADLFAAEPMLANPVCFCVDEKNRFYVAETFRLHAGVTDIRQHMNWLDDDMACRTVEDREALLRKYLGNKANTWEVEHERIRLLEDTQGTGKADRSTVFADGFHHILDGIGAGLVAQGGNVWYACIPDLWLLQDTKGDGKADIRKSLQHGYGVHVSFLGHDLHGLRFGPDGKLYFSIGDRGLNVQTEGRTVASPDTGAVLRCNPDGSELEIIAVGLRNPQELAFDQYGNLFTADNNADHGDKARWVYVVDGGDSGWRMGYQQMHIPVDLGPWNAEKLWYPAWDGQAAYIVPPVANVAQGPSGLTYHPGAALLPERYREHFFLADFHGGGGHSGVLSFAVKPKGASFELVDLHQAVWSVLATDVDFGMDGGLYISDWVDGWNKPNKGRLFRVHDPSMANDPAAREVKTLMAAGMSQRPLAELVKLLGHVDMRVRQAAQFAIVERTGAWALPAVKGKGTRPGENQETARQAAVEALAGVAAGGKQRLARLQAIWGLGQVGRKMPSALKSLPALLNDPDAEVRAQAVKVLGEDRVTGAFEQVVRLLRDPEPRVRFFAAQSLAKIGNREAIEPVLQMLRDNADKDAYLRHAGVMALLGAHDRDRLLAAAKDASAAVRMAVLLALRRLEDPAVAQFLSDADARFVLEAARAINDVPINAALPQLAALGNRTGLSDPLLYRVLNANFRLGKAENAVTLAGLAARTDVPEALRVEALRELGEWAQPAGRDRIVGLWRPLAPRPAGVAVEALRPELGGIFRGSDRVRQEGAKVAGKLGIKEIGPTLLALVTDKKRPAKVRVETLKALEALQDPRLPQAMKLALADEDASLRTEGRRVLAKREPAEALAVLGKALEGGQRVERQGALGTLADMNDPKADAILSRWLDRLLAGQVPLEIQLDLLEAAARRPSADFKEKLARYEASRAKGNPLTPYHEALEGGDAEAGRKTFFAGSEVSCVRCHKINGEGGEVGPDLSKVGGQQKRDYLLESIVLPNAQIAKGFETVVLTLTNGQIVVGIVKAEDAKELRLITAEGKTVTVAKDQIDERASGKSAMPEDLMKYLTKSDLRNLVEFLAGLK